MVAHIFEVIARLAEDLELGNGYRVVTNCGRDGGQSVPHLHFSCVGKAQPGMAAGLSDARRS